MNSIGYGSRISVKKNKRVAAPSNTLIKTVALAANTNNKVIGTDVCFRSLINNVLKEEITKMELGYYEADSWETRAGPVVRAGDPEVIIGNADVNNGAPTIRFKFNLTSDNISNITGASKNICLALKSESDEVYFYVDTGQNSYEVMKGESQLIIWELYFKSGEIT